MKSESGLRWSLTVNAVPVSQAQPASGTLEIFIELSIMLNIRDGLNQPYDSHYMSNDQKLTHCTQMSLVIQGMILYMAQNKEDHL